MFIICRLIFYDKSQDFFPHTQVPDSSFWTPSASKYRDINGQTNIPSISKCQVDLFLARLYNIYIKHFILKPFTQKNNRKQKIYFQIHFFSKITLNFTCNQWFRKRIYQILSWFLGLKKIHVLYRLLFKKYILLMICNSGIRKMDLLFFVYVIFIKIISYCNIQLGNLWKNPIDKIFITLIITKYRGKCLWLEDRRSKHSKLL